MSARSTLDAAVAQTGWDLSSVVDVLLHYIDCQESPAAFDDYIEAAVDEELSATDDLTAEAAFNKQVELDFGKTRVPFRGEY